MRPHLPELILPTTLLLLSALTAGLLASCSEYDTHSVGASFVPVNSQVRAFTHLVYVEYDPEGARVWGPCSDEVETTVTGMHVRLQCNADSLAIIAYGYPAAQAEGTNASLVVQSSSNYALYLSGLNIHCASGPAVSCLGKGSCYLVLPQKSDNELVTGTFPTADVGDGTIYSEGQIILGGAGRLTVRNLSLPAAGTVTHAISAAGLQCQYKVEVMLESLSGDGLHVRNSLRSSLASWDIRAHRHGISAGDSLILYSGTYTGSAAEGAYFCSDMGAAMRMPQLTVASAWASDVLDSLATTCLFDSVQPVWQEQFLHVSLMPDSTYQLVDTAGGTKATLQVYDSISAPYVLISDGQILPGTELQFKQ